jgi:hypothetical protein
MFIPQEERDGCGYRESSQPSLDEASKLLLKAAAVIEERGWCQNTLESHDGRVCFAGAMKVAAYGKAWPDGPGAIQPLMERAWYRFEDAMGVTRGLVGRWNDEPGRTQAEVVAKIRAVALGS